MMQLSTALLLTAGLGTRLRPLTLVRSKPAIPVAGVPMAVRIVRWLAAAGVTDVVMNLHAQPHTLAAVIGDGSHLGVRARYSWEQPVVLGSAGGPKQALDILGSETFLIVNGDTLTDLALSDLVTAHLNSDALVTMAVIPNVWPDHYSGLRVADDGTVLGIEPRGSSRPSFHFIGAQVAHRHAFQHAPAGQPSNSVGEIYLALMKSSPGTIRAHVCDARFWDIGTVADYWETSHAFARDEQHDPASCVVVGSAARFEDSIAWEDVAIGEGSRIYRCILTDGVRVEAGASYSDMILIRGAGGSTVTAPLSPERS
jgi:mannose-1-phosphate guanylyltransferase